MDLSAEKALELLCMPAKKKAPETPLLFPILRGESIGLAGEFSGSVVLICSPTHLKRKWAPDEIAVLGHETEAHFAEHPKEIERLLKSVGAVMMEFGSSVSEWASSAHMTNSICIAKVADATHVVENGMHVRVVATESLGEVFFID